MRAFGGGVVYRLAEWAGIWGGEGGHLRYTCLFIGLERHICSRTTGGAFDIFLGNRRVLLERSLVVGKTLWGVGYGTHHWSVDQRGICNVCSQKIAALIIVCHPGVLMRAAWPCLVRDRGRCPTETRPAWWSGTVRLLAFVAPGFWKTTTFPRG